MSPTPKNAARTPTVGVREVFFFLGILFLHSIATYITLHNKFSSPVVSSSSVPLVSSSPVSSPVPVVSSSSPDNIAQALQQAPQAPQAPPQAPDIAQSPQQVLPQAPVSGTTKNSVPKLPAHLHLLEDKTPPTTFWSSVAILGGVLVLIFWGGGAGGPGRSFVSWVTGSW